MKTVCIYHSIDLDGWMSAAIIKHWWKENNIKNGEKISSLVFKDDGEDTLISSKETITFIGYNHGQSIPDLSEYDKIIMCDISFPKEEMDKLYISTKDIIWIDHHISAIKDNVTFNIEKGRFYPTNYDGIRDVDFAACELTWKFFFSNETMPEIVRLLGMYDSFRHKGTDEERYVLEFQYGARSCISNYEEAYSYLLKSLNPISEFGCIENDIYNNGKKIYQYLCIEAKQTYKNGFEIEFKEDIIINSEQGVGTQPTIFNLLKVGKIIHKFICINKERFNPINFGIDYHKDGYDGCACFHYANGMWNFSLYNDNGEVDCSVIAKQFGGGGHKGAAGFRLDMTEFIKLLNK